MKYGLFLSLFITIFILAGCAGVSQQSKGTENPLLLEPQIQFKFNDVPVPVGFKILTLDSYSFETAGIRVGLLKYQGKGKVEQVVNFYKEQMSLYNWNLLNVIEFGEHMLNFEREGETCIINLIPKGNTVFITVSLGPKSQYFKKTEKPLK